MSEITYRVNYMNSEEEAVQELVSRELFFAVLKMPEATRKFVFVVERDGESVEIANLCPRTAETRLLVVEERFGAGRVVNLREGQMPFLYDYFEADASPEELDREVKWALPEIRNDLGLQRAPFVGWTADHATQTLKLHFR